MQQRDGTRDEGEKALSHEVTELTEVKDLELLCELCGLLFKAV